MGDLFGATLNVLQKSRPGKVDSVNLPCVGDAALPWSPVPQAAAPVFSRKGWMLGLMGSGAALGLFSA